MGILYTSFIKATLDVYKKTNLDFEDFLDSDQMKTICKAYTVSEDSLTWALNLEAMFDQLKIKPERYLDRINSPIQQNANDWNNDLWTNKH